MKWVIKVYKVYKVHKVFTAFYPLYTMIYNKCAKESFGYANTWNITL